MPKFLVHKSYRPANAKRDHEGNKVGRGDPGKFDYDPEFYFKEGDIVETDILLDEKFDNSFTRLEDNDPTPATPLPPDPTPDLSKIKTKRSGGHYVQVTKKKDTEQIKQELKEEVKTEILDEMSKEG